MTFDEKEKTTQWLINYYNHPPMKSLLIRVQYDRVLTKLDLTNEIG
jgi:hypothetical protein